MNGQRHRTLHMDKKHGRERNDDIQRQEARTTIPEQKCYMKVLVLHRYSYCFR